MCEHLVALRYSGPAYNNNSFQYYYIIQYTGIDYDISLVIIQCSIGVWVIYKYTRQSVVSERWSNIGVIKVHMNDIIIIKIYIYIDIMYIHKVKMTCFDVIIVSRWFSISIDTFAKMYKVDNNYICVCICYNVIMVMSNDHRNVYCWPYLDSWSLFVACYEWLITDSHTIRIFFSSLLLNFFFSFSLSLCYTRSNLFFLSFNMYVTWIEAALILMILSLDIFKL